MQASNSESKQVLLQKINAELKDRMSAGAPKQAVVFSDVFFKRVPLTEMKQETPAFFAAMVASQLEFLQQRKQGQLSIRIFNPEKQREGWDCDHHSHPDREYSHSSPVKSQ